MKQFNIVATFLLFFLFITGCMSREERYYRDKALELIKKDLIRTLDDYKSSEPIKTEISRQRLDFFGDTMVQNLVKGIREVDSVLELRRDEERYAWRTLRSYNYSFGDSDKKRDEARIIWGQASSARYRAEQKRLILVDSILTLVEKQDTSIYGWKINHRFKRKDISDIYPKIYDYTYYMDKDCNQIFLKVDGLSWRDDDVYFADGIYKEALERKKEKSK